MKRLFVAVKIIPSTELLAIYNKIQHKLTNDKIRWVNPNNFHLTLKFLGDTYIDTIPIVISVIENTLSLKSSFDFDLKDLGIFGSRYNPRVIWVGIDRSDQLKDVGVSIIDSLDKAGFKNDRQNFVPHLTVARIKHISDKKRLNEIIEGYGDCYFQTVNINKVTLYESILTKEGPIYKEINNFMLG